MKYKLIVDKGKPYELTFDNKELLFNKLLELDCLSTTDESPYCDITILNNKGLDITDETFKQYNFKKEKVGFLI